jgi:hypothetical protein
MLESLIKEVISRGRLKIKRKNSDIFMGNYDLEVNQKLEETVLIIF